jgi:hypothetical protein
MVSAAIAAFFYLRVILLMYSAAPASPSGATDTPAPADAVAGVASSGSSGELPAAAAAAAEAGTTLTVVEGSADAGSPPLSGATVLAIALCVAVTVLFGLWPAPVVDFAHKATLLFT